MGLSDTVTSLLPSNYKRVSLFVNLLFFHLYSDLQLTQSGRILFLYLCFNFQADNLAF